MSETPDYTDYPLHTRVKIKSTSETGDAFESMLNTISVFIDGEDECRYFDLKDVEFLEKPQENGTEIPNI